MAERDRPPLEAHRTELSRDLGEFNITMIGVGAMIGAGIFVLTGIAAGAAGPALMLSFALNGVVTIFTAMVYAELGSAIPEAGGGYLWVKDALGRSNGFLAGWMSWFSHAVAGGLYCLGFGAYVRLLLVELGVETGLPHDAVEKGLGVLIALAFVTINFRGASETGLAGNLVTLGKLAIIGLFIGFGAWKMLGDPDLGAKFSPFFAQGYGSVFVAMGLTFIAFEGYEIIVQAGEEVRNPRRAIPRAVFWSLVIVVPIYVLVAVTAIGAVDVEGQATWEFLGTHKELGLVEAARQFMPFGTLILLLGGLLSTASALNATTYSSTRVAFAMGRDQVLPDAFARVHPRNKTPYVALLASGAIMVFMVVAIPIEDVAAAADVMFLLLFLQVNYAVIRIRREHGDELRYGYLMPFFPWVPLAGIATKAFLAVWLYRYSPMAWYSAGAWIVVGVGVFVAYSRGRVHEAERPRVAYRERQVTAPGDRVLVAVADPSHVGAEMAVAAALGRTDRDELIAVNVVRIPHQLPLERGLLHVDEAAPVLEAVEEFERSIDRDVDTLVLVSHVVSKAIAQAVETEGASTLVIGWKGYVRERVIRGSVAEGVLSRVPADTVVVRDRGIPETVERVTVGVTPGGHVDGTLRVAVRLARGFDATLRVVAVRTPGDGDDPGMEDWLEEVRGRCRHGGLDEGRLDVELVEADSVLDRLRREGHDTDLMVVGASGDWVARRRLLGSIPDALANELPVTVVMVREKQTRMRAWWRRLADLVS